MPQRLIALAVCLLSPAVVWGQAVVLPGTQPGDLVNWALLPPSDCQTCHSDYVAGLDYEPFDSWAGSMMANSARDPLFWAAVDIANQDSPGIGEFCIRCHSPRAWLSGRSSTPDGSGFLGTKDTPDNDYEGVDCHFCHRVYEGAGGTPFLENGQYWVDDGTPTTEPARRGPFQNAFAPHEWAYSPLHQSSDFCGVCHDLRNPLVNLLDDTGTDTGLLFPEQTTYTEWAQSDFPGEGTECQTCHMPPASANPAFACNSFNPPRPDIASGDPAPVARHDLAGANTFMLQVLKGEYGTALNRNDAFDHTIAMAFDMLRNQSATVDITVPPSVVEDSDLDITVRVTNLTGHKLPTGYPEGRRMWVHLEATDAFGVPFFESGVYDDVTATLVNDAQIHVYETKHGIHGQGEGFHLVLNNRIFKDNRIPPRGFMPTTETMPVGETYPVQPGGELAHWSDVPYTIPVPAGVSGPVQVNATLYYQTASREYVEFLRDENTSGPDPQDPNYPAADDRGQKMHDLWTSYGRSAPVDMVTSSSAVPVDARPPTVTSMTATTGHNKIQIDWTLPAQPVASTKLLCMPWGDYPEFGSASSILPAPGSPFTVDDALAAGWIEIYDGPATSFVDNTFGDANRDVVYYAAFTVDGIGTTSTTTAASVVRATSYRLADVGEIGMPGVYDGTINGSQDLPVFSLAYGSIEGGMGWNPECDFGPTDDGSSTGVPTPDDAVDFSDLILFALQFGTADPLPAKPVQPRAVDPVHITVGPQESAGGKTRIPIYGEGMTDALKAIQLVLSDPNLPGAQFEPGPALGGTAAPFAVALPHPEGISVDIAILGRGEVFARDGRLGTLIVSRTGLRPEILHVDGRGVAGGPIDVTVERKDTELPTPGGSLWLSAAIPNPFNPRTEITLRVANPGPVQVAVYDVAGRRVKTLRNETLAAGEYQLIWEGRDDAGRSVASGVYLCRAHAQGEVVTRRMVLIK